MENRGVGYKTDMERGRKKEERKNTPSSPVHTYIAFTQLTLWPHACLCTHTFYGNTGCILAACTYTSCLSFSFSLSQSAPPLPHPFFRQTHTYINTYTHHSGVTGVVSWRERVGDLGVITAWLSDSSDDDIQCFELLWPGPAPNTTRQYTLSTSQPCIHVA